LPHPFSAQCHPTSHHTHDHLPTTSAAPLLSQYSAMDDNIKEMAATKAGWRGVWSGQPQPPPEQEPPSAAASTQHAGRIPRIRRLSATSDPPPHHNILVLNGSTAPPAAASTLLPPDHDSSHLYGLPHSQTHSRATSRPGSRRTSVELSQLQQYMAATSNPNMVFAAAMAMDSSTGSGAASKKD
jgi:hypothetical protein